MSSTTSTTYPRIGRDSLYDWGDDERGGTLGEILRDRFEELLRRTDPSICVQPYTSEILYDCHGQTTGEHHCLAPIHDHPEGFYDSAYEQAAEEVGRVTCGESRPASISGETWDGWRLRVLQADALLLLPDELRNDAETEIVGGSVVEAAVAIGHDQNSEESVVAEVYLDDRHDTCSTISVGDLATWLSCRWPQDWLRDGKRTDGRWLPIPA